MSTLQLTPRNLLRGAPPAASKVVSVARRVRPGLILAILLVLFVVVAAIAPSVLTSRSPLNIDLSGSLQPPSIHHIFGTDQSGRDL